MSTEALIQRAIGHNIREARRALHMTQRDLARKLDLDFAYMCRMEHGAFYPTVRTLCEVAAALGVHPCSLYPTVEDMAKSPLEGVSAC